MTLLNLFTNTVIVSRLTAVSGDKTTYATITSECVNIQRLNDEKTLKIGGSIGKSYRMYAGENADIQEGDKLIDEDGNEYKIEAIVVPAELGNFVHKECIIFKV
jgi:hypothetical protein